MSEDKPFVLKPEWQKMNVLTETVADALRADQSGRITEVTASSIAINEGVAEGWVMVRFPGRQIMRVVVSPPHVHDGTQTRVQASLDSYPLPAMVGKVADEYLRIFNRFVNLIWSNPIDAPSPYAFNHMSKTVRLGLLVLEAEIQRRMYIQAYEERRTQVPDSHVAALEEAWNILTDLLEQQRADLEAGYEDNPRLTSR